MELVPTLKEWMHLFDRRVRGARIVEKTDLVQGQREEEYRSLASDKAGAYKKLWPAPCKMHKQHEQRIQKECQERMRKETTQNTY